MEKYRIEHDLIGDKEVPADALYGVQTLRCIENFNISGNLLSSHPEFIRAFGYVKLSAIRANHSLGLIPDEILGPIEQACQELIDGRHTEWFPIDMVQGGAGTSMNMNANEVIANRALEIMGHAKGEYTTIHPNDHINMAQSTNDAYPTAMHLGLYFLHLSLCEDFTFLIHSLRAKEHDFRNIIKMGRTQLQDAVPMTLGQSFGAFASALENELRKLNTVAKELLIVNMGATAIGTGITAEPGYSAACVKAMRECTGLKISLAKDLIEATSDTSCMTSYSGVLKETAIRLSKICNDLRLMASGPRCGLEEINLPAKQPGSSIMPGKVNPVIPEVVNQVCFKIIGNDTTITMASEAAQLELNVMEPVLVESLTESIEWMAAAMRTLRVECIEGITANASQCRRLAENSIGIVTALKPYIGYSACTAVAKEALETGASVYDLVLSKGLLTKVQLDKILDPRNMIKPTVVEL